MNTMEPSTQRRLANLGGHFKSATRSSGQAGLLFNVAAFQRILEHDNWENRAKMKELMKDDIFVP